jgi:hypothetical protein
MDHRPARSRTAGAANDGPFGEPGPDSLPDVAVDDARVKPLSYWHAVAMLRFERPRGLAELERIFAMGSAPAELAGPMQGRVVATTIGHGADRVFEALARTWMPWKGKTFDPTRAEGRNLFTPGGDAAIRVVFPRYQERGRQDTGPVAFRFLTGVGPSVTEPTRDVLRIDYRDLEENPGWPIRRILDELVQVDDEVYLGQALMLWRGELRRAAWFSLEPRRL